MKKVLTISVCAAMMFACTNEGDDFTSETVKESNQQVENKYHITQEQAVNTLMKIIACEAPTRASLDFIENVKPIVSSGLTRADAGGMDTACYVVNFKENKGFAIMSADTRTEPIYAILDNGNYNGGEEYEPLIKASEAYAHSVVSTRADRIGDETTIGEYDPTGNYKLRSKAKDQRLKGYLWNGLEPFNNDCPVINGERAQVGCSAVAIGTLLTYFQADPQIEGLSIDYSLIPKDATEANEDAQKSAEVAKLLYNVAVKLNTNFYSNSSVKRSVLDSYIQTLPIKYKTEMRDFDDDNAAANFYSTLRTEKKGLIVITGTNSSGTTGHTWLIDGVKLYDIIDDPYNILALYHNVFGYAGKYDGYYLQHILSLYGFYLNGWGRYEDLDDYYNNLYNMKYWALSQRSILEGPTD